MGRHQERVEDTLLAEAGDYAPTLERFRGGKAEHNEESLAALLEVAGSEVRTAVAPLVELGFLEQTGESLKVPTLYREGLSITQGKAFASAEADETADDSQAEHPEPGTGSPAAGDQNGDRTAENSEQLSEAETAR